MKLKKLIITALVLFPLTCMAGPFTDQLSICLVKSTSQPDRELLIKWVFAAMSAHPDVHKLSNITKAEGNTLNRETANLFVDLLTKRCKKQTSQAFKYEGAGTIKSSFSVLGQVAMQGLMSDKNVLSYMKGLKNYINPKDFAALKPKK